MVTTTHPNRKESLRLAIATHSARVGIIGLGYVGLPLVISLVNRGFTVVGFDTDPSKVAQLNAGQSYIRHFPTTLIQQLLDTGRFCAVSDFAEIAMLDIIVICVPTPLTKQREPDVGYIVETGKSIAPHLRAGQLIILESTSYPGTTRTILRPVLEEGGLKSASDFYLGYSPEREDPGNTAYSGSNIPKIVSGDGVDAQELTKEFYEHLTVMTVQVSDPEIAEAAKLTENIFRAVNIALVNELKLAYSAMGIDIWEVIEAAKTKPFGFMPFYPGPGLGGHCVPIDPFYLTWKAREYGVPTRFIELAGEINSAMPAYVVERLIAGLSDISTKSIRGSRVLVLGIAYKKNVDDPRESPSFKIMQLLEARGATVEYHDPFLPFIPKLREHPEFYDRRSVPMNPALLREFDAAVICTDHDDVNYALLCECCSVVVDTRNVCERLGIRGAHILKA